jgi:hypothetical protein
MGTVVARRTATVWAEPAHGRAGTDNSIVGQGPVASRHGHGLRVSSPVA